LVPVSVVSPGLRWSVGTMSAKGKSPAFQFYAAEWLADENVRLMTLEETGAYIDALAICWREGSIPACPEMLARLIGKGCSTDVATVVQRVFNIRCASECSSVERLKHKRLEIEREKQRARSEQQAAAGKRSAEIKRETQEKARKPKAANKRSTCVQHPNNSSSSSLDEDGPPLSDAIPPQLEWVVEYCSERNKGVNAHKWFNHYSANGWLVGKNKMKDWRAAVHTWENNNIAQPVARPQSDLFDGLRRAGQQRGEGYGSQT